MRRMLPAALLCTALPALPRAHAQAPQPADPSAAPGDDKGEIQARALFVEANKRLDRNDFAGAIELYEEAYRRFPDNPKILLNLGTACVRGGRNAAAANAYQRYLDHAKADRSKLAAVKKSLADLDRKVAILEVEIEEPDARVRLDGEQVGQAPQKISRRVEVGPHLVAAEKEGFTPSQATVTLAVGEVRSIQLRLIKRPDPTPAAPESDAAVGSVSADTVVPSVQQHVEISHGGRLGAFMRVDIDGNDGGGAVAAVGGSYGVMPSLELELAALVGASFGAWGGGTVYLGRGDWKPVITLGMPVYFLDTGTLVGAHGALGVEWNLSPNAGVVVAAGAQYYFNPPMGIVDLAFVPSASFSYRR